MSYKPLLETAILIRDSVHHGEPVKFRKRTTMIQDHIEPVIEGCRDVEAKVVAALHDTVEKAVARENARRAADGHPPLTRQEEHGTVDRALHDICTTFHSHGHPEIRPNHPIMQDIRALTKFASEDYDQYGDRLLRDAEDRRRIVALIAKLSDLTNNSDKKRNLRPGNQTEKRRRKLQAYDDLAAKIRKAYPAIDMYLVLDKDHRGNPRIRHAARAALKELGLSSIGRRFLSERKGFRPKHKKSDLSLD